MSPFLYLPTAALCLLILGGVGYLAYAAAVQALDAWVAGRSPEHDHRASWDCRPSCQRCWDEAA